MAYTIKTDGQVLYAADVNDNFRANNIKEVYTGTDFDCDTTYTGGSQSDSGSHEFTAIASTELVNANYLEIEVTGESYIRANCIQNGSSNGVVSITVETKEIGGSYSDSLPILVFARFQIHSGADGGENNSELINRAVKHLHTLTAGEKSNGVQVQVTITVNTSGTYAQQSSFEGRYSTISTRT